MLREGLFAPGEYYHLLGRGNYKQNIFLDERDYVRFLFSVLYFQMPGSYKNIGRQVTHFIDHGTFSEERPAKDLVHDRYVEVVNFALMPNHFHLTVRENAEGGISKYMQRALNGFTKYHNAKYEKTGHLFQGPFKAVHIDDNEQLLYLSAYIHRNPRELSRWRGKEHRYAWSSYQDYLYENRWGDLLVPDIVLGQFSGKGEYRRAVEKSGAKDLDVLFHVS